MAFYNPLIKPKAKRNRNGFDLSQRHLFSAKVGQLLPILSLDCIPNDYHEIDVMALMKTMPVRTDAFARMTQHFEFYFVPYTLLMRQFNDVIFQGNTEQYSSLISSTEHNAFDPQVPCTSLKHLLESLNTWGTDMDSCKDMFGVNVAENAYRLLDLLGYGSFYSARKSEQNGFSIPTDISNTYDGRFVNLFRIAAYNKIWYDYYRNKYYDNDSNYVYQWSLDDVAIGSTQPADLESVRSWINNQYSVGDCFMGTPASMLNMHYRQWKKDLFTSLMPSQQFGAVSAVDLSNIQLRASAYASQSAAQVKVTSNGRLYNGTDIGGTNNYQYNVSNAFDVYALRRAEVLQGWKEDTLRAGHSAQSQYRAHFGETSKYTSLSSCEFIGACSSPVQISQVVSTADTDNASLGAIAGKGSSFSDGKLKFNCSDYGVLMCIYSIVPESDYDALGLDKQNTMIEPFDFFTPAFEDLGLEPIYAYQLSAIGELPEVIAPGAVYPGGWGRYLDSVMGYSARYSCYKTAFDKVHGEFMSRGMDTSKDVQRIGGSLSSWTIARGDLETTELGVPLLRHFYIDPQIDSSIFFETGVSQDLDHFLVDANFGIKSVRDMSVLGLPRW